MRNQPSVFSGQFKVAGLTFAFSRITFPAGQMTNNRYVILGSIDNKL